MELYVRDDALTGFKFYQYNPSLAAAVLFIVLFAATTGLHAMQMIRTGTWFMIPFLVGGTLELIGYCGRAASSQESPDWTIGPYIVQSLTLLVAPALLAASIYMELARIVLLTEADHLLFIRRTWLTRIFVIGDCCSFLLQAAGGGMMAGSGNMINIGEHTVMGGLGMQIIFFGLFVLAGIVFHVRLAKAPTPKSKNLPWQKHMFSLYAVSVFIFIRSIVRLIEYGQGFAGYVVSHEVYLYLFDSTLMFFAMVIMNVIHPSEVAALIRGYGKMVEKVISTKDVASAQYQMRPWT